MLSPEEASNSLARSLFLPPAPDLRTVQTKVSELLRGRILVGHALRNDLKALLLAHPRRDIRDTSRYQPFRRVSKVRISSSMWHAARLPGIASMTSTNGLHTGQHFIFGESRAII